MRFVCVFRVCPCAPVCARVSRVSVPAPPGVFLPTPCVNLNAERRECVFEGGPGDLELVKFTSVYAGPVSLVSK